MTYFLSGVYLLPQEKRDLYKPAAALAGPLRHRLQRRRRASRDTVEQLRLAWLEGNEIGTHFNGHFCGKNGGVGEWSRRRVEERDRPGQAVREELEDQRRPEERGSAALRLRQGAHRRAAPPAWRARRTSCGPQAQLGFRYDTSGVNDQVWPEEEERPVGPVRCSWSPSPGTPTSSSTMDYNFMVNQSGHADPGRPRQVRRTGATRCATACSRASTAPTTATARR